MAFKFDITFSVKSQSHGNALRKSTAQNADTWWPPASDRAALVMSCLSK